MAPPQHGKKGRPKALLVCLSLATCKFPEFYVQYTPLNNFPTTSATGCYLPSEELLQPLSFSRVTHLASHLPQFLSGIVNLEKITSNREANIIH